VITPTPRDFEIYEAYEQRVAGSHKSATGAFTEVAVALHVSVGQVAESCYLVQQLTRTVKAAAPLPGTSDFRTRAIPGERDDDTKELVLKLHHAIDQLAGHPTDPVSDRRPTPLSPRTAN
jgi:predicted HAD superfamily Cof-like phosphohydrolase